MMKAFERFFEDDLIGVRFAINVFIGTAALWLILRGIADKNPIWAIASMIAASEPIVKNAVRMFRARIINTFVGCVVGLLFLVVGPPSEWKLPLAISAAVLVSSYAVRVQTMWRQAPITAAIVIAAGLTSHSELTGVERGLDKVGEVVLGCVMGLLVSWIMSRIWRLPEPQSEAPAVKTPGIPS